MDVIHEPNHNFNFEKLLLSPPLSISSGNHFIKYSYNESPLYIQTPKCKIKQGIMKTGKKMFCDLVFPIENEGFTHWLENLENYSQKYIFEKREKWFETSLEKHDIENSFSSPIKLIKSGKCFTLRSNIPMILGKHSLKIYNESEQLIELEDLKEDSTVVSVLEIQGIKCSTRGFHIDIEIKQLLVLNPVDIFEKCVLLHGNKIDDSFSHICNNNNTSDEFYIKPPHISNALLINDDGVSSEMYKDSLPLIKITSIDDNEQKNTITLGEYETINSHKQDNVSLTSIGQKDQQILTIESSDENNDSNQKTSLENIDITNEDLSYNTNKNETILQSQKCLLNDEPNHDYQKKLDMYNIDENINSDSIGLTEINFNLEEIPTNDSLVLKNRNDVYYNMYREALNKAKMAKELSLSSYLEAKRIKNIYMLNDLSDEDSDIENDFEIDGNNEK